MLPCFEQAETIFCCLAQTVELEKQWVRGNGRGVTDTKLQVWHLIRNWSTAWIQAGVEPKIPGGGGGGGTLMMRAESAERWEACVEKADVFTLGLSDASCVCWASVSVCVQIHRTHNVWHLSLSVLIFFNVAFVLRKKTRLPRKRDVSHADRDTGRSLCKWGSLLDKSSAEGFMVLLILLPFLRWLFWPLLIDFLHRRSQCRDERNCCSKEGQ